jgi:micrococcal nuclease
MILKRKIGVILLIILTGILYWNYTGQFIESDANFKEFIVERVVDGDTVVLNNSEKVRLLGINTPEKNMPLYEKAKIFLESLILNKTVFVELVERDRYGRILGYIFVKERHINQLILENGFGHLYYYDKDERYDEMFKAEEFARENSLGIWGRSDHYGCLEIIQWTWLDKTENEAEKLVLGNECGKDLDIIIKDDATHIYREEIFMNGELVLETKDIWNDNGDSIYIWDETGLVEFKRY